ncbi:MAG: hypothetical protein IKD69_07810, partial [Solobacterium sp.]|nr:hypothetical protein [Solobacterium sp.]
MPSLSEWKIFLHTRRNPFMKLIAVLSVVCVIHINAVHTARKAQDTYEAYLNQAVNTFTYASSVQKAALEMNTLLASSADDAVTFSYAYYDQNEKKTIFCTNALFSDDGTFVADIDRIIPGSVLNRMMIYHWSAVQESSGYLMLAGFSDEEQLVAAGCMHVIDSELRSLSANDLVARMNADDREIIPVFFQQWEAAESVHWRKVQCLFPYLDPNSRSLWRKWNYDTALQEAVKVFVSQPT